MKFIIGLISAWFEFKNERKILRVLKSGGGAVSYLEVMRKCKLPKSKFDDAFHFLECQGEIEVLQGIVCEVKP